MTLWEFWNQDRQDNYTTATRVGHDDALAAGYRRIRYGGSVYPA